MPVSIELYEAVTPLFEEALGIYYSTNYYVARQDNTNRFGSSNVFYTRFVYDLISMFGFNLFNIELPTLESLIRRVYAAITFRFEGKLKLRSYDDVRPAFTEEECIKAVESQTTIIVTKADKNETKLSEEK